MHCVYLAFSRKGLKVASTPVPVGRSPQRWAGNLPTCTGRHRGPENEPPHRMPALSLPTCSLSSVNGPALSEPLERALSRDFNNASPPRGAECPKISLPLLAFSPSLS